MQCSPFIAQIRKKEKEKKKKKFKNINEIQIPKKMSV